MSKKRNDLWIDSESDSSIEELSKENCSCLICSILPALSNGNCCTKHLTALMIPPGRKHRYHGHSKKLRPVILTAFNKNNRLHSPNHLTKSTMNKRKRSSNASSSEPTCSTTKRVIHTRDEQDETIESHSEIIINMSQIAKQDIVYSEPRILLKRVYFEQ